MIVRNLNPYPTSDFRKASVIYTFVRDALIRTYTRSPIESNVKTYKEGTKNIQEGKKERKE